MKRTKLEWLTNIDNPNGPYADSRFICMPFQDKSSTWDRYIEWVNSLIKGPPKETEHYSSMELYRQGMIGLYKEVNYEDQ